MQRRGVYGMTKKNKLMVLTVAFIFSFTFFLQTVISASALKNDRIQENDGYLLYSPYVGDRVQKHGDKNYQRRYEMQFYFSKDGKYITGPHYWGNSFLPGAISIPSNVYGVSANAFGKRDYWSTRHGKRLVPGEKVTSIYIPSTCKVIGDNAFSGCAPGCVVRIDSYKEDISVGSNAFPPGAKVYYKQRPTTTTTTTATPTTKPTTNQGTTNGNTTGGQSGNTTAKTTNARDKDSNMAPTVVNPPKPFEIGEKDKKLAELTTAEDPNATTVKEVTVPSTVSRGSWDEYDEGTTLSPEMEYNKKKEISRQNIWALIWVVSSSFIAALTVYTKIK